jgi:hypothetical protein
MPYYQISTQNETVNALASVVVLATGTLSGSQIEKVNNLPTNTTEELASKVDSDPERGLSRNDFDNAYKAKLDNAPADINTALSGKVDADGVKVLSDNNFSNTYKNKLDSIDEGATDDQTGVEIKTLYEAEANTNAFTDTEKTKLSGIDEGATDDQTGAEIEAALDTQLGGTSWKTPGGGGISYQGLWDADTNDPTLADGTGTNGYQYKVGVAGSQDLGSGSISYDIGDILIHNGSIWQKFDQTETVSSVAGKTGNVTLTKSDVGLGSVEDDATADQTGAEIKSLYEAEANTNAYTDTEKSKLATIENSAKADQTDEEIETAYNNQVAQASAGEMAAGTVTDVRRMTPYGIATSFVNYAANKNNTGLNTTNKTVVGAINENKDSIDNISVSGGVDGTYADSAALLGDQGSQTENSIYVIEDYQGYEVQVIKKASSTASSTDYYNWPKFTETYEFTADNTTTTLYAGEFNQTVTGIRIEAASNLSSEETITFLIDGETFLSTQPTIATGDKYSRDVSISDGTWNAYEKMTIQIPNIGTDINVKVTATHDGIPQSIPIPQLNAPTISGISILSGTSVVVNFDDPNTSPNEAEFTIEYDTVDTFDSDPQTTTAVQDATSKQINSLTEDQIYYFRVRADGDGSTSSDSDWSGTSSATPTSSFLFYDFVNTQPWNDETIPNEWIKRYSSNFDANNYLDEVAGGCRFVSDGTIMGMRTDLVLANETTYDVTIIVASHTTGQIKIGTNDDSAGGTINSAGTHNLTLTADSTQYMTILRDLSAAVDMVIESIEINPQ